MTTLTMKDEKRIEVIQRVFRGELMVGEAAMILAVTERQCYRIKARVKEQGAKGVVPLFEKEGQGNFWARRMRKIIQRTSDSHTYCGVSEFRRILLGVPLGVPLFQKGMKLVVAGAPVE